MQPKVLQLRPLGRDGRRKLRPRSVGVSSNPGVRAAPQAGLAGIAGAGRLRRLLAGWLVLLIATLAIDGCESLDGSRAWYGRAEAVGAAAGLRPERIWVDGFVLFALVQRQESSPIGSRADAPLVVFLEGDGLAWRSRYRVGRDPTPRRATGVALAAASRLPRRAYLARPCHFLLAESPGCRPELWTTHRFGRTVVDATAAALDRLKALYGVERLVLVGYSGGATLALLLAVVRADVEAVITVAGVLDHAAWTTHHGVPPLTGSLAPSFGDPKLTRLPQVHIAGGRDRVAPPRLSEAFAARLGHPPGLVRLTVAHADHGCCWPHLWPALETAAMLHLGAEAKATATNR